MKVSLVVLKPRVETAVSSDWPTGRSVERAKPVYAEAELMRAGTRSATARTTKTFAGPA